jgi:hypothetical protein
LQAVNSYSLLVGLSGAQSLEFQDSKIENLT